MPTPMSVYNELAAKYGNVDPNDDDAVDHFFTSTLPNRAIKIQQAVYNELLARDGEPERIRTERKRLKKDDRSKKQTGLFPEILQLADSCKIPRHFKLLLRRFREHIPYQSLIYGWGFSPNFTLNFWDVDDYPVSYLTYYVEEGVIQKDPVFKEWLRTQQCQIWEDVFKRLGKRKFDPKHLRMTREYRLDHTLVGGYKAEDMLSFFSVTMKSDSECQQYFEDFNMSLPVIGKALRQTYPKPKLTNRQLQILNLLSLGYTPKAIGEKLNIESHTTRYQLEQIKTKLSAKTEPQAVRNAITTGMLSPPGIYVAAF